MNPRDPENVTQVEPTLVSRPSISRLSVADFKPFSGPNSMRIAPITLLYGPNSSGKSSVLQTLLLLKQTLEAAENPETLLLPKGPLVDLGGYRDFVYQHDTSRLVRIRIDAPLADEPRSPWLAGLNEPLAKVGVADLGLEFVFTLAEDSREMRMRSLDLFVDQVARPLLRFEPSEKGPEEASVEFARRLRFTGEFGRQFLSMVWFNDSHPFWERLFAVVGSAEARRIRRRLDEGLTRLDEAQGVTGSPASSRRRGAKLRQPAWSRRDILRERERYARYTLRKGLEDFRADNERAVVALANFLPIVLPGLRAPNQSSPRDYARSEGAFSIFPEHPWNGEALASYAADTIRVALENLVYLGPLREYPERHYVFSGSATDLVGKSGKALPDVLFKHQDELTDRLNAELDRFGVGYNVKVAIADETSGLQDVFAVRLEDTTTGVTVNLRDVGFGISQILPVIVQTMLSSGRLICIEQPEIHLHPRLQAEMADLLVDGIARSNTFVVETHSEHLMLRIQRLIRERRVGLRAKDVSVVYVDRTAEGARLVPLRLDDDGDFLDPWPGGFFEESFREVFG